MKCPECDADLPEGSCACGNCGIAIRLPHKEREPATRTISTPSAHLNTGFSFDERYQIIEELGSGGMGTVYRAYDQKLGEEVALKLIKPEIAADQDTVRRFGNELKLTRRISHRHIGRLYELMEAKGTHYITMEYIPGEDLRRLIKRIGQVPLEKAVQIALQVCDGLDEAHRLGIVHRDLKPGNILIDHKGDARILDFGIARSMESQGLTQKGIAVGTPEYMSPEQVDGLEADKRSDIYSLGIILYEMLTGKRPFEGKSPFAIGYKHKMESPQDPRQIDPNIPGDVNRIILDCLHKDRDSRFQTAGEVRSALNKAKDRMSAVPAAGGEGRPRKAGLQRVRIRLRHLLIPGIILLAAAVVVVLFILFDN